MVLITSKKKSAKLERTAFEVNENESKEKKLRKAVAALQRKARREKVKESLLSRVQQKPKKADSHSKPKAVFPTTRWNALHSKSFELLKQHVNTSDDFESSDSSSNVSKKITIRNVKPRSKIPFNNDKKQIKLHVVISSPRDSTMGRHESPVPSEIYTSSTSVQPLIEKEKDGNNDEMDDMKFLLDRNASDEHGLSESADSFIPPEVMKEEMGEIKLSIEDLNPIEFPNEDCSSPTTSQIIRTKQEEENISKAIESQLYPEAANKDDKIEDFSSTSNSSSTEKRHSSNISIETTGLEVYRGRNSYSCEPCNNRQFATSTDFIQHSKYMHLILLYSVVDPDLPPVKFINRKYICQRCKVVQFTERRNYVRHVKKYHSLVMRKDEEEPYNNPHNHCIACCPSYQAQRQIEIDNHYISCEATYGKTADYHLHLYKEHGIMNPINPGRSKPNPSIKPDEYDPNSYCCSCEKKFQTKRSYKGHLRKAHKIYQTIPYQR